MRLVVKDWFHENKMNELKKDVQTTNVFAILKETEKAYNVFVAGAYSFMTYWVPKSCVEEVEETDEYGAHHNEAIVGMSFDDVLSNWKAEREFYI